MNVNRSQHSETVEKIRLEVERTRLDFIVSETETAFTLARSAETLYRSGSTEQADRVHGKAWEACNEALNQLESLPIGQDLRNRLTDRLERVRTILDSLPTPVQK